MAKALLHLKIMQWRGDGAFPVTEAVTFESPCLVTVRKKKLGASRAGLENGAAVLLFCWSFAPPTRSNRPIGLLETTIQSNI